MEVNHPDSKDKVYETRLNLAAAGMPKGSTVGFELFNQNQLGSTDFDRRLKYNWALQGSLCVPSASLTGGRRKSTYCAA